MKIKTNREALLEPLLQINGVVERRQTLPILANVLIKCETDQIALTATDLEVELQTSMPADCSGEYELTLPARKLLDICKALPANADIEIDVGDDRAILKSGRGRYSLGMLAASEYPVIESIDTQSTFTVTEQQLKKLIDKTGFAMAQQDVRYYLNGLLLEITSDRLRAVATDGHRLALSDTAADLSEIEERKVILPRKAVLELGRLLSDSDDSVQIALSKNHARFQRGNTLFTTKLIDGRFPDYERVIPASGGSILEAQRDELKQALQRASILSNEKYRGIRFSFAEDALTLVANNPEQEEAEETVDVSYSGDEMSIGFNVGYVLDVLNVIDTEEVELMVSDPNSSAIMTNKGQNENRYVIMPMRL